MEFDSWDSLLNFYNEYLKKDKNPKKVRFLMDRDDEEKVIGYIEDEGTEEASTKEFTATLTFPTTGINWVMMFGFHFFPTKLFELEEDSN